MRHGYQSAIRTAAVALVATAVLTSCGTNTSSSTSATASSPPAPASSSAPASTTPTAVIPDPCSLLTGGHLTMILGSDPGEGVVNPSGKGCEYGGGLMLGVTAAAEYAAAAAAIAADTTADAVVPLTGVGEEAMMATYGTNRVIVSREADFAVAVQGMLSDIQAQDLAEAMLESLRALSS